MTGIPLPLATDAEDVVWALQTADALWKRGEQDEAVIWLRRSAQAAGATEDDERALLLARAAAEMADSIRRSAEQIRQSRRSAPELESLGEAEVLDDSLSEDVELETEIDVDGMAGVDEPRWPETPIEVQTHEDRDIATPIRTTVVPDAAYLSAGYQAMEPYAPAENESFLAADLLGPPLQLDLEEVDSVPSLRTSAASPAFVAPEDEAEPFPLISSAHIPAAVPTTPTLEPPMDSPVSEKLPAPDLSAVQAFGDLPDDVRDEFARAANVRRIGPEGQIGGVALALVVEGTIRILGPCAFPLIDAGGVVRVREDPDTTSTTEIRAVSPSALVASWGPEAVAAAFSHCPWVDDDLREAGDHLP